MSGSQKYSSIAILLMALPLPGQVWWRKKWCEHGGAVLDMMVPCRYARRLHPKVRHTVAAATLLQNGCVADSGRELAVVCTGLLVADCSFDTVQRRHLDD